MSTAQWVDDQNKAMPFEIFLLWRLVGQWAALEDTHFPVYAMCWLSRDMSWS